MADAYYIPTRSIRQKILKRLVRDSLDGNISDRYNQDLLLNHYLRTISPSLIQDLDGPSLIQDLDGPSLSQVITTLDESGTKSILIPYPGMGHVLLGALALGIPRIVVTNNYGPLNYCYQEMISDSTSRGVTMYKSDFVSQEFQSVLVNEHAFEAVFLSIGLYSDEYKKITKESDVDTERQWKLNFLFPLILLAWKTLDRYGKLYICIRGSDYKQDILMMMKSFENGKQLSSTRLDKEHTLITWKKLSNHGYVEPERLIVGNRLIYTIAYENILDTILTKYFRMIPKKVCYLVRDMTTSTLIIKSLVQHGKDKDLILFVPEDQVRSMKQFGSNNFSIQTYREYNIAIEALVNKTNASSKTHYFVEDLDTNIHLLSLLTDTLQENLNDIPLVLPSKLWLKGDVIVLQALARVLPNTYFVYVMPTSKDLLPVAPRTTIIKSNIALKVLWETYGLATDSLLE
jgi:hypothetical protein